MLVSPIRGYSQNNSKISFRRKDPVAEMSKIISKQSNGAVADLKRIFSEKEIRLFYNMGMLKGRKDRWVATPTGKIFAAFNKTPTATEKEMGIYCDSIGF